MRSRRIERGLSQAWFARTLGVPQVRLSNWETGKCDVPDDLANAVEELINRVDAGTAAPPKKRSPGARARTSARGGAASPFPAAFAVPVDEIGSKGQPVVARPCALALFAGCGGFSHGVQSAGFNVVGFVELNEAARAAYRLNFPDVPCLGHDIRGVSERTLAVVKRAYPTVDLVFGGPPCQGFSLTGKRDPADERNRLFEEFVRVVETVRPHAVVLENVRLLTSMKTTNADPVSLGIVRAFNKIGYACAFRALNAQEFGVPQFRDRVFFIALNSRRSVPSVLFPNPTHGPDGSLYLPRYRTFRDATSDLLRLESGELDPSDIAHFAVDHPPHVVRMLRDVPEGRSAHENEDPSMRPPSGYNTTYKRLRWDEPSSTIGTTFGMISGSRNVHPEATRSLTVREALRCQSFPDSFKLCGNLGDVRTMIGNAVPPLLARVIAASVLRFLVESPETGLKCAGSNQPSS